MNNAVYSAVGFALIAAACAKPSATSMPPAPASIMEDSAVVVAIGKDTLHGTLELPARAFPVPLALIIAGSGPTDRNGNSRILPGANNSLRYLARGLAERGIASLRYDKRGIGASAKAIGGGEQDLRFDTYVDDARAWMTKLRADGRFSTITVVGHSEGSLIGMLVAREAGADAFVSLEGAGRNAKDVIAAQLAVQLPEPVVNKVKEMMRMIEAGEKLDSVPPMLAPLFRPSVQPYLASWFRYTPSVEIAKLTVPSLVVQGTTDLQTTVEDAKVLANGHAGVQLLLIDGMNHVLKMATGNAAAQAPAYSDPALPVVPQLLEEVAAFIKVAKKK